MSKISLTIMTLSVICASSAAWAVVAVPIDVPEPGLFGIAAAGVAAVILATRLRKRK